MSLAALTPTRRVRLTIGGTSWDQWHRVEISRDLSELAGSVRLEFRDASRTLPTFPWATPMVDGPTISWGDRIEVAVDGETYLIGWIDEVAPRAAEGGVSVSIEARDVTGDLVDCAPDPRGKHEYRNISLTALAEKLCKPFNIKVRAECDVSPDFDKVVVEAGETVLSAIEKYARQRGVLVTSDGVGALVLTRSGRQRAAGALAFPGNIVSSSGKFSARERFSDYFVKGQAEKNADKRAKSAPLDVTAGPLDTAPSSPSPSKAADDGDDAPESAGALVMGHAQDPEVKRWRPYVAMAKTKAKKTDAQKQADWLMRTRKGKGETLDYQVQDWCAAGGLWRPNTLAPITDSYQQVTRDMLIAGVRLSYDEQGHRTQLRIVGPEAYDLEPVADRATDRKGKTASPSKATDTATKGGLDATPRAL